MLVLCMIVLISLSKLRFLLPWPRGGTSDLPLGDGIDNNILDGFSSANAVAKEPQQDSCQFSL